jgi:hypothetical protein
MIEIDVAINYIRQVTDSLENRKIELDSFDEQLKESIEILIDIINKYAVTDKADGERNFMIIYENHVYSCELK